jgi:hypothetical protein
MQRNNLDNYFGNISEADRLINQQILEQNKAELVYSYLQDKRNQFSKVPSTLSLAGPDT